IFVVFTNAGVLDLHKHQSNLAENDLINAVNDDYNPIKYRPISFYHFRDDMDNSAS
ncbi:unnamed protein product, partial [Didymodactylos carnosus]